MTTYDVPSLAAAERLFNKHQKARQKRIGGALVKAARRGLKAQKDLAPRAFGGLKDSGGIETAGGISSGKEGGTVSIIFDAPWSAPTEVGSRPHMPPLGPILAWVKLRGMQALTSSGKLKTNRTRYGLIANPNIEKALAVGKQLRSMPHRGGFETDIDAPMQIAKQIQLSIARNGTKPQPFARPTLSLIDGYLAAAIREALPDRAVSQARSEAGKKAAAARTPEARKASAAKGAATRRAKKGT